MKIELEITRTSVKVEFDSDPPQKSYTPKPLDDEQNPLLPDTSSSMIVTVLLTLAEQAVERLESVK